MDNYTFRNNFNFNRFHFPYHHTNHLDGVDWNYIGILKVGQGTIYSGNKKIHLKEGEYVFIPKHCRYESFWEGHPECIIYSYGFIAHPEISCSYSLQKVPVTEEMRVLETKLEAIQEINSTKVGLFYQLLGEVISTLKHTDISAKNDFIEKAIKILQSNPDYSVKQIAEACGMSESNFYITFKRVTGRTPIEMKHKIQVEEAIELLKNTDMTVEMICAKVGFCSTPYFRKVLLKETGRKPKEIRNNGFI